MLNGLRLIFFKTPVLKDYANFILYLKRQLKIRLIKQSDLIQKQPDPLFLSQCKEKKSYVYLPWINTLTNKIIRNIDISKQYQIIPL